MFDVFECSGCVRVHFVFESEFDLFGSTVSHLSLCSHWFENACSRNAKKIKIKRTVFE